jgi:F-type H+-transporting ATPase subunit delta
MSDYRVANRYAKSLLDLAQERDELEQINTDMTLIQATCKGSPELQAVLKNPIINHFKKLEVLKVLFGEQVSEVTNRFIDILCRKKREAFLYASTEQFHVLYNKFKGVEEAEVITPIALTDELRAKFVDMVQKMSGKTVELTEKVDAELLGGYVLRVQGNQIDDSVRSRLNKLRKDLIS